MATSGGPAEAFVALRAVSPGLGYCGSRRRVRGVVVLAFPQLRPEAGDLVQRVVRVTSRGPTYAGALREVWLRAARSSQRPARVQFLAAALCDRHATRPVENTNIKLVLAPTLSFGDETAKLHGIAETCELPSCWPTIPSGQ